MKKIIAIFGISLFLLGMGAVGAFASCRNVVRVEGQWQANRRNVYCSPAELCQSCRQRENERQRRAEEERRRQEEQAQRRARMCEVIFQAGDAGDASAAGRWLTDCN